MKKIFIVEYLNNMKNGKIASMHKFQWYQIGNVELKSLNDWIFPNNVVCIVEKNEKTFVDILSFLNLVSIKSNFSLIFIKPLIMSLKCKMQ